MNTDRNENMHNTDKIYIKYCLPHSLRCVYLCSK